MRKIETNHFTVSYSDEDNGIIEQISKLIDDTYDNIVYKFGLRNDWERFDFILCPNVPSFMEKTGKTAKQYREWMVGNADYTQRSVCILSPNAVKDRSFEDMLAVIRHEIIHLAFGQLQNADEADIMISEGIAVAFADQIYIPLLNDHAYPDARRLSDEEYFYENNGYLYSGVYVLHLLRRHGTEVFKNLYTKKESIDHYWYDGFERDAIHALLAEVSI